MTSKEVTSSLLQSGLVQQGLQLAKTAAECGDAKSYGQAVSALVAIAKLELAAEIDDEATIDESPVANAGGDESQRRAELLRFARELRTG